MYLMIKLSLLDLPSQRLAFAHMSTMGTSRCMGYNKPAKKDAPRCFCLPVTFPDFSPFIFFNLALALAPLPHCHHPHHRHSQPACHLKSCGSQQHPVAESRLFPSMPSLLQCV